MGRTQRTTTGLLVLAAFTLAACGADSDDSSASDEPAEEAAVEMDNSFGEFDAPADAAPTEVSDRTTTAGLESAGLPSDAFGRDLILEIGLTMATDDVGQTAEDIRRLTTANGGAVFSSDIRVEQPLDDGSVPGGGSMTVRIPPQDLDRLIADLNGLGGVIRVTQDSDDVTEQLVDLEIRIRQSQAGIERVEEILGQTADLNDLFAVENELTRRQVELERLLASQRATEDRVALATLTVQIEFRQTVDLTEPAPDPADDGIGDAFRSGWDAFVGALFAIGFVLAVLAPFLAAGLVLAGVGVLIAHRLRSRARVSANTPVHVASSDAADASELGAVTERADEPSQMV